MQHLHLTHQRLDFWVAVEIYERDGRSTATADIAEDSRGVGVQAASQPWASLL